MCNYNINDFTAWIDGRIGERRHAESMLSDLQDTYDSMQSMNGDDYDIDYSPLKGNVNNKLVMHRINLDGSYSKLEL